MGALFVTHIFVAHIKDYLVLKFRPVAVLAIFPFLSAASHASEDNLHFGAGLGFNYSGLGGYASYTSGSQIVALSAGVRLPVNNATVGAGASWLRTDFIGQGGPDSEHALGVYVGSVGAETYPRFSSNRRINWGAGPMYQFYENGATSPGLVVGVGVMFGHTDSSYKSFSVSLGYQF
ncbi:hypothetical protein CWE09_08510 [Aliidiomarina minuta]|uniref:Outer membrane protein beta-barrel domain-containing protein n=1 Tax=Aliidiomarina minuta TaxID=880057 RepID=A0A432W9A0_9GAMM|nr:hypothetical protein [Aliidiomarina minuta]RUO26727.1 hypothetical protein CWE09_08510 [Aliidiomarina minuta]